MTIPICSTSIKYRSWLYKWSMYLCPFVLSAILRVNGRWTVSRVWLNNDQQGWNEWAYLQLQKLHLNCIEPILESETILNGNEIYFTIPSNYKWNMHSAYNIPSSWEKYISFLPRSTIHRLSNRALQYAQCASTVYSADCAQFTEKGAR